MANHIFISYNRTDQAYARKLAAKGWKAACQEDRSLALGLNVVGGKVVYPGVAEAFNLDLTPLENVI